MNFLSKFNQLSEEIRLAFYISGLWLFFVGVNAYRTRDFYWKAFVGCAVFPLFLIWGIWWVRQEYKKDKGTELKSKDEQSGDS
jgi:hypothetical protein